VKGVFVAPTWPNKSESAHEIFAHSKFLGSHQAIVETSFNKPQQEGITTKPGYKELFILILQKTSNNN